MAIQIQGANGVTQQVDGSVYQAGRVAVRPLDHGTLGHYRIATTVALPVSTVANATLFSFRWGDATRVCVPTYIRLECIQTAPATATIMPSFEVVVARSFSISDSAGTAVTLTGNNMKKRTNMGTSLVTDIRKAALAAGLTAGTRTLDTEAAMQMPTVQTITTPNTTSYSKELDLTNAADHPIVLVANEGFIIRGPSVAFGAAGTANLMIDICWAEVASY